VACINGASTTAGNYDLTCSCSSTGSAYNPQATYDIATGCACTTGYAKDASNMCTRESNGAESSPLE
jgi:hypothetical protein